MDEKFEPTRRSILSAVGGLAAGTIASGRGRALGRDESGYVLVQGEECVPIEPIRGDVPVEEFYDYQLPEKYVSDENGASVGDDAPYASAGTLDLQREATSLAFLYLGPEGVSLVVIHGVVGTSDGGSVTFRISGLPSDGRWVVKDDLYRNPDTGELASTNYDRWQVDGSEHRIDWTWGSAGTDGGAFRDLGDEFEVVVDPSFNEYSPLYGEHYEGTITDWEFLTAVDGSEERVSLDMSQPIRIRTGTCEAGDGGAHRDTEQKKTKEHDDTEKREEEDHDREEEEQKKTEESDDEQKTEDDHDEDKEKDEDDHDDEDDEDEGKDEDKEKDEGEGKGHEKGKGKGHEKGNGEGHDKHGDDDDDDDDDDD